MGWQPCSSVHLRPQPPFLGPAAGGRAKQERQPGAVLTGLCRDHFQEAGSQQEQPARNR